MSAALALGALLPPLALFGASRFIAARLAATYRPVGHLVDVDDHAVHVVERGPADAPAIVLVHGASGNWRDQYLSLGRHLARRYRVFAVDRPGQGHSARAPGRASAAPDDQSRRILAALAALGLQRALVVGHSLGAATAVTMALAAPSFVCGLVLLAPATHPWGGSGISWHNRLIARIPVVGSTFAELVPGPIGAAIMRPALDGVFRPDPVPFAYATRTGAWLVLRRESFRANAEDVAFAEENFRRLAPRYPRITCPTLVVSGTEDPIVWNHVHSDGLMRDLPNARRIDLPVGHMPHWGARDTVLAAIEDLVREIGV